MKLKTKNTNSMLFKKSLYLMLFIFFFIFSGSNALVAQAADCKGPADVVLAIDRSANMAGESKFDSVKNSSIDFIGDLFATPPYDSFFPYNYHQIGLEIFNNNIASELLTTDYARIQNVISNLGEPTSSCKVAEAVQKARSDLNASGNIKATKTIIILIAGPPDNTDLAIEQVRIATASEIGIRVIAVGINLDQLTDPQKKADAERFITNDYINSYDCYYASDDPDAALDGCVSISASDLSSSLNVVYNDITGAVCDEIAPTLEISRIPSGTLYSIDKLIITSIATDDVGFKSHSMVWGYNWPDYQTEITNCNLIGKTISCDTGLIGPFAVGKTINFGSSATDANDNVITIDPLNNAVKVAAVSLSVPVLSRNKNNRIDVRISDYSGADNFYVRVDNGAISRIIDENNASSKMTCSGTGSIRDCYYYFNPSCASEGVYTDPSNTVDIYIYAVSSGITRTSYISSSLNNILGVSIEGVSSGNCGNGIDDDCDGIVDSDEILCDSEIPAVTIRRTNPVETSEVYDDDASITLKSEASDDDSTIKRNTIYYRIAGSPLWTTAFDCNDANADGKCDEDISKSVASFSVVVDSIFPALAGTEIEYYSKAVDSSGNDNTASTSMKSFVVKSKTCEGIVSGECCQTRDGDENCISYISDSACCGGVCDTSISNPNSYNTAFCAKEICNGTSWEWGIDISKNNTICSESGSSDGCYPYLPTGYFWDGGCEERAYKCSSGYCAYGVINRNGDYCIGGGSLILNDYECVGSFCAFSPNPAVENDICDVTLDSLSANAYNSDSVLISGSSGVVSGEVLDNKTNNISLISSVIDANGISEHKIYWRVNSGVWSNKNCGTCSNGNTCSCTKEIGPYSVGDVVNFYAWAKDNSPNKTARATATYSFSVRDSDCYNIPGGNKTNLTSCGPGSLTNGKCCGGSCDTSVSPTLYDSECRVDACSGTNWVYAVGNEGNLCGAAGTCFPYYTGCINGNKCTSGYCNPDLTGKQIDLCAENLFDNYGCSDGSCGLIGGGLDCSLFGNSDGDTVACNCDCNRYDIDEKVYSSLSFDGADDYVTIPNDSSLNPTSAITVEVWAKSDTTLWNNYGFLVSKRDAYIMHPRLNTKTMNFYVYLPSAGGWKATTINIDNITIWNHYVGTYNSSTGKLKLYVNGDFKKEETYSGAINADTGPMFVGKDDGLERYFNGSIDDVRIYNRALYLEEVRDHYNGIFADDTGLVGHWDFDPGLAEEENEIVGDRSVNVNNGSLSNVDGTLGSGSAKPSWVSGKYGDGLDFDGGDYVALNNLGLTTSTNSKVSVEFWMRWDGGNSQMPFGWSSYDLWFVDGNFGFNTGNNDVWGVSSSGLSSRWVHTIAVFNNGDAKLSELYLDGSKQTLSQRRGGTGNGTISSSAKISGWNNGGYRFDGLIDEVRIYNRALSDAEAAEHYKGIFADNSGLVGYWDFNEGSGTTAHDSSENGPGWTKYHYDSASGISGNVPVPWQVCTDGKDNDCDLTADDYIKELSGIAESGGANTLTDNDMSWIAGEWQGGIIEIISGTGIGQFRTVSSNTATAATVDADWDAGGIPDSTSEYNLIKMSGDCDGKVDGITIEASSKRIGADGEIELVDLTDEDYIEVFDIDVSQAPNDFTLLAMSGDDFGIGQTRIEWTTDNWGTENYKNCDYTGVCKVCVIGGTCDNDIISPSSLAADTVFTYRACAWDNNNNKICSDDYNFIVLNSNSAPWLTNLGVIVPDFCEKGLEYILSWKFNDNDILDKQSYYEVQVKEDNNDWTTGPFVIDVLKYVSADNPGFSYHPIINGEDLEYGGKIYYWRVRATDNKTGGYAKTSDWVVGDSFTTPTYRFPHVEFSANSDSDPDKDCFILRKCYVGEDIVFHDNTAFFVSCDSSNNKQCLNADAAKCDVGEGRCVACEGDDECNKFESPSEIQYFCNTESGICETPDSCVDSDAANNDDDNCKSTDAAKCDADSEQCVACDNDLQCTDEKFDTVGIDYFCNSEGVCEDKEHREWWFYGDNTLDVDSVDPNPINNYVESVFTDYDVILKITDIMGESCLKSKRIFLGGELYPKWNEISSSN